MATSRTIETPPNDRNEADVRLGAVKPLGGPPMLYSCELSYSV